MLYIVATPIGNLEDITLRALRILREVDFVLCEDTRVTAKLLSNYDIHTKTISYHQHSKFSKTDYILSLLGEGKDLALVTDAGTPGISDPGGILVQAVIERFDDEVKVESIPGPSAVVAALSISGIPTDKFVFMGFPPHKKGRMTFIHNIFDSVYPVVVYESKHRILKFLRELQATNDQIEMENEKIDSGQKYKKGEEKKKKIMVSSIVVCRELSKMHETVYRGEISKIYEKIESSAQDQKGEFVVIVGK